MRSRAQKKTAISTLPIEQAPLKLLVIHGFRRFCAHVSFGLPSVPAFVSEFHERSRPQFLDDHKTIQTTSPKTCLEGRHTKATPLPLQAKARATPVVAPFGPGCSRGTGPRSNDRVIMINLLPPCDYSAASFHRFCRWGN